ncbi:MAG: acyl-CoA dehydrogenase family protein, partial [Myxococcales bacterium]|nr:acyl-CoA dehydrogenase family protein [Myxococcales bacterium]
YMYRAPDCFKDAAEAVSYYKSVMELVGEFSAEQIAPFAREIDTEGVNFVDGEAVFPPRLQGIFEQIKEMELHGMCVPRELGGQNFPLLIYYMNAEVIARADVSVMAHHSFHGGMAMAMLAYSVREGTTEFDLENARITKTRFAKEIEEIRTGAAWGCMDITEPDAGSDMAALRAVGEQDADGNWFVTGTKIFITSGHGKYHFVIARTEDAGSPDDPMAGLKGLSMFLVPTYVEHEDGRRERIVTIDRLEEKVGHHGSATCTLSFERAPAQLIGQRGEGFKYMLTLMNNARLGVGFESLGLCEAANRLAVAYAAQRESMGKTIDRHEMIADYLDEMRTDIQGLRALGVYASIHEELAQRYDIAANVLAANDEVESQRYRRLSGRHKAKARRVTPLAKAFGSERAVFHAQRCIQIHGGVGYTKEYGAEKLLRDAMVLPIYEGTTQIQALMAMKDSLMGIMKDPAAFLSRLAQWRWRSVSARDPLERRVAKLKSLSLSAQQHLMQRTATDKLKGLAGKPITAWPKAFTQSWDPKRDFAFAMLHAERLLWLLTDEAIAGILLEQAQQFPERRELLERWLERAEPRARMHHDQIHTTGDRILAKLAEAEADTADRATA